MDQGTGQSISTQSKTNNEANSLIFYRCYSSFIRNSFLTIIEIGNQAFCDFFQMKGRPFNIEGFE